MRGFELDAQGDVVVGRDIATVEDTEAQNIRQLVNANKGEWFLSPEQGLPLQSLLTKIPSGREAEYWDLVRNSIQACLLQVDSTYRITAFEHSVDRQTRKATITFTAQKTGGEAVAVDMTI